MRFFLVIIIVIYLGGCHISHFPIYQNEMFGKMRDVARNNGLPFCIVLIDSSQRLSRDYYLRLQNDYTFLKEQAIFNLVDINSSQNEWYVKWLCPVSTPLTCIFSQEGKLIDLIPGAARESFLYTKEVINNYEMTEFHWPNQFQMNKKEIIPYLNNLLEQKEILNQGVYLSSELSRLVDSLNYPYSIYMKLLGELMVHDTVMSKISANSLIKLKTPFSFNLYKKEFITAEKVLNPDFDIADEPIIRINEETILLPDCLINQTIPVEFTIYNDGNKPLIISKIYLSCSCLKNEKDLEGYIIGVNDSLCVRFAFTPDIYGKVSRDIFITSNSINTPILHINILANAISNNEHN